MNAELQDQADAKLERQIDAAFQTMLEAQAVQKLAGEIKEWAYRLMTDLIAQRSPEQVRRMERRMGLR